MAAVLEPFLALTSGAPRSSATNFSPAKPPGKKVSSPWSPPACWTPLVLSGPDGPEAGTGSAASPRCSVPRGYRRRARPAPRAWGSSALPRRSLAATHPPPQQEGEEAARFARVPRHSKTVWTSSAAPFPGAARPGPRRRRAAVLVRACRTVRGQQGAMRCGPGSAIRPHPHAEASSVSRLWRPRESTSAPARGAPGCYRNKSRLLAASGHRRPAPPSCEPATKCRAHLASPG